MMLKVGSSHKIQNNDESFNILHSLTPAITSAFCSNMTQMNAKRTHIRTHCYLICSLLPTEKIVVHVGSLDPLLC